MKTIPSSISLNPFRALVRALSQGRQLLLASALALTLMPAQAVDPIAVPEAGVEAIFANAGVPIDLRIAAGRSLVDASLLDLNSAELFSLRSRLGLTSSDPRVALVVVDTINAADFSASNDAISLVNNGTTVMEAAAFTHLFAAHVLAQGLGFNLGLSRVEGSGFNLMNPTYLDIANNPAALTAAQIQVILRSPLLQTDASGQRFIDILPVFVTATAVPEPAAWALMLAGVAGLGLARRVKRRPAVPA